MKNTSLTGYPRTVAFTLIEMIGVLAILTIMAGVLTPNVLHSIERAAVQAEEQNLRSLSGAIASYMKDYHTLPTEGAGNWNSQLAIYSSLSAADIVTNKRQDPQPAGISRLYVIDTVTNKRALLISSMRRGVALPGIAAVRANFQGIWDAAEGAVPPGGFAPAWTNLSPNSNIEYLVIERVSVADLYQTLNQTFAIILNQHGGNASYKVTPAIGTSPGVIPFNSGTAPVTLNLKSKDRLDLYSSPGGVGLNFSYVVSNTPKSFDFTTVWTAL
jgi:type II secretory pathway pseudopilin PulG